MNRVNLKRVAEKYFAKLLFFLFGMIRFLRGKRWILLYRTDELGDVICTLPHLVDFVMYARKNKYRILLAVQPQYRWITEPFLDRQSDRILTMRPDKTYRNYLYRLLLYCRMYTYNIELSVNYVCTEQTPYLSAYVFARKSYMFILNGIQYPEWMKYYLRQYTHILTMYPGISVFNQLKDGFERITGEKASSLEIPHFELLFPELGEKKEIEQKYCVIFPGAAIVDKCWAPERYAQLCNWLMKAIPDLSIVILGTEKEKKIQQSILTELSDTSRIYPMCGKTSLKESFAWTRNASFMVGNDSGGGHIAALYRVPSFLIVPGTDFGRYMPNDQYKNAVFLYKKRACFGCLFFCKEPEHSPDKNLRYPCLDDVSVEDVIQAIKDKFFSDGGISIQRRKE